MSLAGVPGASFLTLAVLVLGIIQIGPSPVVAPLLVWGWATMTIAPALAFTACMAMLIVIDSFLKPFVLARGLTTPMLVTLTGVIGGIFAHGIGGVCWSGRSCGRVGPFECVDPARTRRQGRQRRPEMALRHRVAIIDVSHFTENSGSVVPGHRRSRSDSD